MKKYIAAFILAVLAGTICGCASMQDRLLNVVIKIERNRAGLVLKTVRVNGDDAAYLEREGKGETIVLIHGFAAEKDHWIRFVRHIPEAYRVLAIDMPGHGDNVQDRSRKYDPNSLSHGIAGTIEKLGLKRFHIVGNSLGGLVSKLYTYGHPGRVITLGLFDSAGMHSPTPSDFELALKKGENPFLVKSREDYDRLNNYAFYRQPFDLGLMNSAMARKYIKRNDFNQKMFSDLIKTDTFENNRALQVIMARLKMPVFVIWGDKDRLLHVSSVEAYKRVLQQAETLILKDCGHVPMVEQPKVSARHYTEFLMRHPDN